MSANYFSFWRTSCPSDPLPRLRPRTHWGTPVPTGGLPSPEPLGYSPQMKIPCAATNSIQLNWAKNRHVSVSREVERWRRQLSWVLKVITAPNLTLSTVGNSVSTRLWQEYHPHIALESSNDKWRGRSIGVSQERNTARQLMFGPKQLEGWSNLSHDFKPLRRRQHMVNNQNNSFCGNRYGLPSLHHTPADTGLIHHQLLIVVGVSRQTLIALVDHMIDTLFNRKYRC